MHLKRLDLFGFKSFAEKTTLHFEPGVTAVVGPNGCGKSNLVDAVKWVLGEQSAREVRGAEMADVIFNGSADADPINFAEVALTLSNDSKRLPIDYDEVTVARRVYRDGTSEYFLNKTQVRLKDIMDLLLGTGIGTSAYFMIEQGKIDLLISSRPEDRRELFEEASGIAKFRAKKREAERRLAETEQNLLRIGDIIQEVKRQIASIERQAAKAEAYRVLFEELKSLESKQAAFQYRQLAQERGAVQGELDKLQARERELEARWQEEQAKLSQCRQELEQRDAAVSALVERHLTQQHQLEQRGERAQLDQERIQELTSRHDQGLQEIDGIGRRMAEFEQQQREVLQEIEQWGRQRQARVAQIDGLKTTMQALAQEMEGVQRQMQELQGRTMTLAQQQAERRNEAVKLKTQLATLHARLRRLTLDRGQTETDAQQVAQQATAISAAAQQVTQEFEIAKAELASAQTERQRVDAEREETERHQVECQTRIAGVTSTIAFLQDLTKRHEGFHQGVRALLEARQRGEGPQEGWHGVLAELLQVQPGYELAVEVALGDLAQAVVVQTRAVAETLAASLAQRRQGRARFLIVDELPSVDDVHPSTGVAASSVAQAPAAVQPAVRFALRQAVIVDSADTIDRARRDLRWITKDGQAWTAGLLTGGQGASDEMGLIGRERRIEAFEQEMAGLRSTEQALQQQLGSLAHLAQALTARTESVERTIRDLEVRLSNRRLEQEQALADQRKLQEELDVLRVEVEELGTEVKAQEELVAKEDAALHELEAQDQANQQEIQTSRTALETHGKTLEQKRLELSQAELDIQHIDALAARQQEQHGRLGLLIVEQQQLALDRQAQVQANVQKRQELELGIQEWAQVMASFVSEIERIAVERAEAQRLRQSKFEAVDAQQQAMESIRLEKEQLREELFGRQHNMTELIYSQERLADQMQQRYQVDLATYSGASDDDPASAQPRIDELKAKLERMGPVNLVAIDEKKELEERYAFLTTQQADLEKGQADLEEAIAKINQTTKQLFTETFEKVREEFKGLFRQLFGGGEADLYLLDEQDVLESGIEIAARPPGKKLQTISLLSGGEKALTAIALLFGIFKVKPSPFCILDELDAPLDEANIDRFTRLLQEFVKQSQFIMITHNKKTIQVADVMYGITMEKSGISKIVSVKFAQAVAGQHKAGDQIEGVAATSL